MTLTSADTAGLRRGVQDRLIHLVANYPGYFAPHELRQLEPLHVDEALPWDELDRLGGLINYWLRIGFQSRRGAE